MTGINEVISESRLLAEQGEFMIVYYDRETEKVSYTIYPLSKSYKRFNFITQATSLKVMYLFTLYSPCLKTIGDIENLINDKANKFLKAQ